MKSMEYRPILAASWMIGHGVSSRSSHSSPLGRSVVSANSWTQDWICFWSSLSSRENSAMRHLVPWEGAVAGHKLPRGNNPTQLPLGPTMPGAMTTADGDPSQQLEAVERARQGSRDDFVQLYRQDAPPAWRLGLALTGDADRAADAVAEGFRRTLAPLRPSAPRTGTPFRLRLLTATRQAALDGPTRGARPLTAPNTPADDAAPARSRSPRAAEVMAAFGKLPERWRTILWLLVVEGLGTLDAARVLNVRPEEAEDLADRAQAGLRERWTRDQRDMGIEHPEAPDHLDRQLQPVLPLPRELFALAEGRWLATRRREPGPLRFVLPGGRPVPRWAERSLVGATAALIALGITERAGRRQRGPHPRHPRGRSGRRPRRRLRRRSQRERRLHQHAAGGTQGLSRRRSRRDVDHPAGSPRPRGHEHHQRHRSRSRPGHVVVSRRGWRG